MQPENSIVEPEGKEKRFTKRKKKIMKNNVNNYKKVMLLLDQPAM
jgi:hypothetical protein